MSAEPKTCAACGGLIITGFREEFCSLECYRAGRAFCKYCGKALEQKDHWPKKVFCNPVCGKRYRTVGSSIHPSYWEEARRSTCKMCNKPIEQPQKGGRRLFCGQACSHRYHHTKNMGLSITEKWGSYAPETRKALREVEMLAGTGVATHIATSIDREYILRRPDIPRQLRGGITLHICKTCGKEFHRKTKTHRSRDYCSYACQHEKEPEPKKLTWEQVEEIRILYEQGMTQATIAEKYDVSSSHIHLLVRRHLWKRPHAKAGENNIKAKLTWEKVREIRHFYASGQASQKELAEMYGVSHSSIKHINRGEHWKPEHDPKYLELPYAVKSTDPKLTWEQVDEIRHLYATEHLPQSILAKRYGVHKSYIQGIITYRNRKPEDDPRREEHQP